MRKLLLILLLASCSAESIEEEVTPPEFAIFIMDDCPNGSGDDYWVELNQEDFETALNYVRSKNESCVFMNLTNYQGEEYSGYWGGVRTPDGYELPTS